jgi:argininosuccinate lyase
MREGRFSSVAAEIAQRYSESVSFDRRLYRHDIAGSIAHASALASAGILAADEFEMIARGLREIENEIAAGTFVWDTSLEDVHMNIEAALTKRIGAAGGKMHTARSRNDQIALDLRLYVREEIDEIITRLRALQNALLLLAQKHCEIVMPGYTHLQRAQPIYFAHYLLAQLEAFERDHERLRDTRHRADVMPLGSGALAGSTIALDREAIGKALGFQRVTQNSVDAVGDRDFVADFLYSLAMIGIHLSRFSEDLIIWSTSEFGFIEFSDAFATGSSLMPQKKNPDMAELTRGKSGRLIGNLVSLLTILKGLPSSYNRDLQEDKEALFDSVDTVRGALELFSAMLPELTINRERMESLANDPQLLATDLAEYLVGKGVPFREAHAIVGKLTAGGKQLDALSNDEFRAASNAFAEDVREVFDVRKALQRRSATGTPSPENISRQLARWRELLV